LLLAIATLAYIGYLWWRRKPRQEDDIMIRLEKIRLQTSAVEEKEVVQNVRTVLASIDDLPETT